MDESLITEVEKHAIIYNRQKKNLQVKGEICLGKEFAWRTIAKKLGTDGKIDKIHLIIHKNK